MNNHFLTYLFESSICMLFFYIVYIFFLKKETYFHMNRTYLLCSVILSLLIPTIEIKNEVSTEAIPAISKPIEIIISPIQSTASFVEKKVESNVDILFILLVIYLAGVVILFSKSIYQFFRLTFFIKKGEIVVMNRHYMICTNGQYPTSSFFKYILWDNTVSLSDKEIDQIIKHEMAHINHLHTLDNLLMEIMGILFWFNPLIYLYNKELKEIHEYIADKEVLHTPEYTRDDYEVLINKQVLNNIGFQLSNNFNMSNLKTRIAMITKPKSGKTATLKLLIVFPVAALMMFTFSLKQTTLNAQNSAVQETHVEWDRAESISLGDFEGVHATVAGIQGGKLSVQRLLEAGKLEVNKKKMTISSFDMSFAVKSEKNPQGNLIQLTSQSGAFTDEMKKAIASFKPGQKVYFEYCIGKIEDGKGSLVKLPGVLITIE